MKIHKIVVIMHWGVFFSWFCLAILTQSMIDLVCTSIFLFGLLQLYPVFKSKEEKNGTNV